MILLLLLFSQTLATYRAQHRSPEELVEIASTALGEEGQVVLDARTATLVLSGASDAVARAVSLLEEMDRPVEQLVLTSEIRELSEKDLLEARVTWKVSRGAFRIGTTLDAAKESTRMRSRSTLRLLSGRAGSLVTGEALPFLYEPYLGATAIDFVPAETGFEARAAVLGDGNIRLDLRPFSGRFEESGALRYTAAETSLTIAPGDTVVIAESSSEREGSRLGLRGGGRHRVREETILLVTVDRVP